VVNYWFFKRASDAEMDQSWYYFRMLEPDFTPLPVYDAMRAYTAGLEPALHAGTYQEDHWALAYCSADPEECGDAAGATSWEAVNDPVLNFGPSYLRAGGPEATLRVRYVGAGLVLAPGPGTGRIEVIVDGGEPRQVALGGQLVRVDGTAISRLLPAAHVREREVVIRVLASEVGIDAVRVEGHAPAWPWIVALVMVVAVGLCWLLQRTRD
jgi:hypothetical protein